MDRTIITTKRQLTKAFDLFVKEDEFAFDVETMDFSFRGEEGQEDHRGDPLRNDVVWLSLASENHSCVIPMGHPNGDYLRTEYPLLKTGQTRQARGLPLRPQDYSKDVKKGKKIFTPPPAQLDLGDVMDRFEDLFFDNDALKIAQNGKFDLKSLAKYYGGEIPEGPYFDTMLGAWLLDSRRGTPEVREGLSLDVLVKHYLGLDMVKGVGKKIEEHSFDDVAQYAVFDSEATFDLVGPIRRDLKRDGMEKLMRLEMDVLDVVCRMELHGAPIDTQVLEQLYVKLEHDVEVARGQVFKHAGYVFNINSVPEKQKLLYTPKKDGGRGLKTSKTTSASAEQKAIDTGEKWRAKPVDAATLEKFRGQDPCVDALLEYQDLNKLLGTYVIPYRGGTTSRQTGGKVKTVEKPSLLINGRVHGIFKQNGAETGRFSSTNPNLQNIPNASTENGEILRSLFYAPPGYTMVICDYSQIEPRIIASLSQDPVLHGAYDDGVDVYTAMAEPLGMERAAGKLAILAMSYGVGPEKIEEGLHLAPKEGKAMLAKFEKTYAQVYRYKARVVREAAAKRPVPYVQTILGRRRYLPGLRSSEWSEKGRAERQVFNALIQGCLPADARVLTRDGGWLPIGEFVNGTEVWTGENWAKAIKVDRGVDTRIRLHLSDGRTFDCDTRHKLLVNDGVWPRWATMDEIVGLPLVRDTQTVFGSPDGDPEDWYWLGRMIGDGHTASPNAKTKVWTLAFGPDEQEDVARFTSWLDGKDFRGKTNSKRGYSFNKAAGGWVSQVVGGTRKGFEYWTSRGVVGGSRGKRVPAKVFTLDKASRQAFFDGYFDADGHRADRISKITSVNRPLLEDTLRLMQTLGMHGKVSSPMKNGRGVEWFDLYIHGTPTELTVERVEYLDPEPMMTLSVFDEKHAFSSEGIISKNTAADVMKIALVRIDRAISDIPDAQLILTVHDEVVALCREDDAEEVGRRIQEAMESVRLPGIDIPMKAAPDFGPNWASKH